MNKTMASRFSGYEIPECLFHEQPKRTVDEATPEDVKSRAAAERKRLVGEVKHLTERLAQAKADLKFWEGI